MQVEVLTQCARRCALCYGVDDDFSEKQGQIAHLDKDRSNSALPNLAFLCFNHHDRFDGVTSQSKGYKASEIVHYQKLLHQRVEERFSRAERIERESTIEEKEYTDVEGVRDRCIALGKSPALFERQILARAAAYKEALVLYTRANEKLNFELPVEVLEEMDEKQCNEILDNLQIPRGTYGILPEGGLPDSWADELDELVPPWVRGQASYDDCSSIISLLDDFYDLDLSWILYGLPISDLPRLAYSSLKHYVYEFGMRGQSSYSK